MRNFRNLFLGLFWVFFVFSLAGGFFWASLKLVREVPVGRDFIGPWTALQNFALNGESPYSSETTLAIQRLIYGRSALPAEYPYQADLPFHLLILFLPLLVLSRLVGLVVDLTLARAFWVMLLQVAVLGAAGLALAQAQVRSRLNWFFLILAFLFSAFWLPSVAAVYSGNSILIQVFCLAGALRAFEKQADELSGALALLALVNLQATGMAVLCLFVWAFSTQRWRFLAGFGMTLALLFGLSLVLLPSWELPFFQALVENLRSTALPSTYSLFETWFPGIGRRLAQILAIAALTIILIEWSAMRGKDLRWLFWTTSLTVALTPLLGFSFMPAWLALTLPGLLLAISSMGQRWGWLGLLSALLVLSLVFAGLWLAQLQGLTMVFLIIYPCFLTLCLYWIRWAAIRPPRLWADEIALRG